MADWDAIVLAGGKSSRLGGIDKTALVYNGNTLLDLALAAVSPARSIAVVGPDSLATRLAGRVAPAHRLTLVREEPRFGGPASAIAAGFAALGPNRSARTVVVAADLLFVGDALPLLLKDGRLERMLDGVAACDETGRVQHLLAAYSTEALAAALDGLAQRGPITGVSVRELVSTLLLCAVVLPPGLCSDIDTPEAAAERGILVPATLVARAG